MNGNGYLNKFRKEKKLTQKAISENIGCHHKTIAYMDKRMDSHIFIQYLKLIYLIINF